MADWVASGYDGGTWQGNGIRSSAAAAQPQSLTAVGIIDNNDTETGIGGLTEFAGELVSLESVLAACTWWGDANLDGILDSNDYDRVDTNFARVQQGTVPDGGFRWAVGDFDGDGAIDSNDYDLIDNAFVNSAGGPVSSGAPVPTPEPATLALLAIGALALLRRRR
ncbi:MAG TPA: PEP-CTERM sorting domain-containing protein [Phycisphaerae bacterium]|nr:PEP-CTERM sorting domain-containing protein [Phycisphaerae bacterium]